MGNDKIIIDEKEIDEIIDLYIKIEGGNVPKIRYKCISDFNETIANNPQYKRKDGTFFKLYKYHIWAGKYGKQYNYGKLAIMQRNKTNSICIAGEEFDTQETDIIGLVNHLHKKPQELTSYLVNLFSKERKKNLKTEQLLSEANNNIKLLESRMKTLDESYCNLFYLSQSPYNSLNNMMNLSKSGDSICYQELKNMFGDLNIFEQNTVDSHSKKFKEDTIVELSKSRKLSKLDDDGF